MKLIRLLAFAATFLITVAVFHTTSREKVFRAPRDSRLIGVKKGDAVPRMVWEWNEQQIKSACTAEADRPELGARKGDHIICNQSAYDARPGRIPRGYCVVYYTSGCPTCGVGWVYARGERCENCLNCAN